MKKMKKLIGLLLVVALVGAAIGGTIAYLTDTEGQVNVMTVGKVDVTLEEKQRNADGSALEDFKQGKELTPLVGSAQADKDKWGQPMLENYVDKIVYATNNSSKEAYIRFLVAVPVELIPDPEDDQAPLHWNYGNRVDITGTGKYNEVKYADSDWAKLFTYADVMEGNEAAEVTIDGEEYWVTYFTMIEPLAGNETSLAVMSGLYLDNRVDYDDVTGKYTFDGTAIDYDLSEGVKIPVLLQAVQTDGWEAEDGKTASEVAFDTAFGTATVENCEAWFAGLEKPVVVANETELVAALNDAADAKSGSSTIYLANDIALTEDWTPVTVDGYNGAGVVTLEGQGYTITNLTAPLFKGGFAGESGIIIKDLTITDSTIESDDTQGAGAFIMCVDSMETIILDNCHLLNSTVYAPKARTGGLVGWTSGYSNQNDGPVKTYVTISDCSVIGCKITGTAVGGINGHAGASDWTYTTIENCTVLNNTLTSTDDGDWRVGAVIGTANVGEVTIKNTISGNNDMSQAAASSQRAEGLSDLVGRFVPGSTGKLLIEDTFTAVSSADKLVEALEDGGDVVLTESIEMEASTNAPYGNNVGVIQNGGTIDGGGNELYIECYGDDYGIMTSGGTIKNLTIEEGCRAVMIMYPTEDVIIDNVKIGGDGVLYPINTGEKGADGVDLIVTNSTLAGWTSFSNIESASFTNVKFEQGTYYNDIYGRVLKPYVNTTITDCSFIEHMNLDLSSLGKDQKVTITNCTVNGQAVTADVFTVPSTDADYDTALFTVDLPSWANSITNCVIFK